MRMSMNMSGSGSGGGSVSRRLSGIRMKRGEGSKVLTYHNSSLRRWIEQMRVAASDTGYRGNVDDAASPLPFVLLHLGDSVL